MLKQLHCKDSCFVLQKYITNKLDCTIANSQTNNSLINYLKKHRKKNQRKYFRS